MSRIASVGLGIPKYSMTQENVKTYMIQIYTNNQEELHRLLPVFDHALIEERQFVVNQEWFLHPHTFAERNRYYQEHAQTYALKAIDECLTDKTFLKKSIPYEAIDLIIFISSTGIATPTIDVYLSNERPFRESMERMPLWGLGCAGGAIGLSRAHDYLQAYPEKSVLVICVEFCSLAFQKDDFDKSHIIGTALFGDGAASILLLGEQSPYLSYTTHPSPKIVTSHSLTKKQTTDIMGWDITDRGFEVIFSKEIPQLVHVFWKKHVTEFLNTVNLSPEQITYMIAHPGGRKVLEAMEDSLSLPSKALQFSYDVLRDHGNMSSATVYYVINQWLRQGPPQTPEKNILCALGPGFSSELLLLEWG